MAIECGEGDHKYGTVASCSDDCGCPRLLLNGARRRPRPRTTGHPQADFPALRGLCNLARPAVPRSGPDPTDTVALPPTRVFDNLYFVGSRSVSSWAIATDEGIILIDALRNAEEVRAVMEPGLRSVGLNPANIKYVLVTHGHGDHYGGVRYLVERYRPRVVMSAIDWREVAKPKLQFDAPHWGRPPVRDVEVTDGDRLTLGRSSIELHVMRTHTPGTISPIIRVTDRGRRHTVLLWGGTAFNFGPIPERLNAYAAAAERMRTLAAQRGVDVFISNHPRPDGSGARMEVMRAAANGASHPFVIGRTRVANILGKIAQCARAQATSLYPSDGTR